MFTLLTRFPDRDRVLPICMMKQSLLISSVTIGLATALITKSLATEGKSFKAGSIISFSPRLLVLPSPRRPLRIHHSPLFPLSLISLSFPADPNSIGPLSPTQPTLTAQLKDIKERGKLIVAVKDNVRPLGFTDPQGNLQGLEIDIAKRLAAEILGSADAVVLQPVTNQERLEAVTQRVVDIAVARVTVTESRARLVDFSPTYYLDGTGLVTNKSSVEQLEDLALGKIAVLESSSTVAAIKYRLPSAQLVGVDSYQEALSLLEAGAIDAFAGDRSVLAGWVQEYPAYRLLPERLSGEALAVVMPKGLQYVELREQIEAAIFRWRESGWLQERAEYWGLP